MSISGSFSDCVGWEIIVLLLRSVLMVVKTIVVPCPIFGIVDDSIPDAISFAFVGNAVFSISA